LGQWFLRPGDRGVTVAAKRRSHNRMRAKIVPNRPSAGPDGAFARVDQGNGQRLTFS
jgi:hypothetical protein